MTNPKKRRKSKSSKNQFPKSSKKMMNQKNVSNPSELPKLNMDVHRFMNMIGTLLFATNFNDFGLIPKILGINRVLNKHHVNTLATIIRNGNNLWNPIFVIQNKFDVKPNYFAKRQMENIIKNADETYSIIDENGNVPRYLIIDGQHRFEAFEMQNTSFPYYDVTNVLNIKYIDDIIEHVNNFNIGAKSYTTKQVTEKNSEINPYLIYFNKLIENKTLMVQKDRTLKTEGSDHVKNLVKTPFKKTAYKIAFINKGTKGYLKKEINNHVNNKYMNTNPVSSDLKAHMRDMVIMFKMVNKLLDGYTTNQSYVIYKFLGDIKTQINYNNLSFRDFLAELEKHLTFEKEVFMNTRKCKLNKKIEVNELTHYLFSNLTHQALVALRTSGIPFVYNKDNNTIDI